MVRIDDDQLIFSFPEVHPDAVLRVGFQRTLRIPDDGTEYPLPPGLGPFPLRHVDDLTGPVGASWKRRGGIALPMYPSEALWLDFSGSYPMAVKVASGKINAVTGDGWDEPLHRSPQDYLVTPAQPWLDGFVVGKGVIRQFVAMPLGAGYTVEEQLTGAAEHGGLQLIVYPLRPDLWESLKRQRAARENRRWLVDASDAICCSPAYGPGADMGMGAGGTMRQEIFADRRPLTHWTDAGGRCFVHLANALVWRAITGEEPPPTPATAAEYERRGLPWFEFYAAGEAALEATDTLARVRSIHDLGQEKGHVPLPENESAVPGRVVPLGQPSAPGEVRQGPF